MLAKIKEQLNLDEFEINYKREQRRLIKRKLLPGERNTKWSLTPQQKFNTQVYLVIVDSLIVEMEKRSSCYQNVQLNFSVLFDFNTKNLLDKRNRGRHLQQKYPNYLEIEFENELIPFHDYVNIQIGQSKPNAEVNIFEIFKDILSKKCYPNVAIAFRIYLTIACGVCEGERSFSKLALIKNQKRSVMCQDRLDALSII